MANKPKLQAKQTVDLKGAKVQSITFNKKSVTVEVLAIGAGSLQTVTFNRSYDMHPDFKAARAQLEVVSCELCEVPHNKENPTTVTGVAFKYKNNVRGAVIKAKRVYKKSNGVLPLNTPIHWDEGESALEVFDEEHADALDVLADEALKYLMGKSSQLDLMNQSDSEAKEVLAES